MFDALANANWPALADASLTLTLVSALVWTWRWIIVELRRERDYWRTTALTNLGLAEKGIDAAAKSAVAAKRERDFNA